MKHSLLRPYTLGLVLLAGATAVAPLAQAAPKSKSRSGRLEIWPGQRTLIVLPLTVNEAFLSNENISATTGGQGSGELARALVPLVSPQLASSLTATGKFSITRPYKFDPLLRRALTEQRLTDEDANAFVETPSLSNARSVLSQIGLDQPGMVAQVVLQSLTIGGTPAAPTVQVSMRGDLYEAGGADPFRTINVTSRPFAGKTPEDRLRAATGQAFSDIAAAFVEPPAEFDLPVPPAPAPSATAPATPGSTPRQPGAMMDLPSQPAGNTTVAPIMSAVPPIATPATATPATPNPINVGNAPVAPQLPGATPPLGVNVPEQ